MFFFFNNFNVEISHRRLSLTNTGSSVPITFCLSNKNEIMPSNLRLKLIELFSCCYLLLLSTIHMIFKQGSIHFHESSISDLVPSVTLNDTGEKLTATSFPHRIKKKNREEHGWTFKWLVLTTFPWSTLFVWKKRCRGEFLTAPFEGSSEPTSC